MAASFMVGSQASPCKPSSRTTDTDISTVVGIISTPAEASGTTETIISTTGVSSVEDTTTSTISQSEASTKSSAISEDVITTTVSTTDLSSIIIKTTETSTLSADSTTTGIPTTTAESTTTAEVITTTTTTEPAAITTFITNSGFDDETDNAEPWALLNPERGLFSIDSDIKHDGRNSGRMWFNMRGSAHVGQPLREPIQAGVPYRASAWVRGGYGCTQVVLLCAHKKTTSVKRQIQFLTTDLWHQVSLSCTFSQDQVNAGDLYVNIQFYCDSDAKAWMDTITFSKE
ncbi:hypothetical protein FPOA_08837 [Fusarium poae]|uniref:CBM-cenC domain-containing protein n=1 Tax=Fusarium poae TaxID=36050 RepID=A0A1B8APR8_FUSPO|nr:hypothetical protein FPOA_08837 [Fusarium poae]